MLQTDIVSNIVNKIIYPLYNNEELKYPPSSSVYLNLINIFCKENDIVFNDEMFEYIDEVMFEEHGKYYTKYIENLTNTIKIDDYVFYKGIKKRIEWMGIGTFKCVE